MFSFSETFSGICPLVDLSLSSDDNPNQTQEISRMGEQQNVDKEMSRPRPRPRPSGTFKPLDKQKRRKSAVWEHFTMGKDEDGNGKAKCNLCGKLFDSSSKKGTTHNHFKSCQKKRNEGGASGSGDKPAGNCVTVQQLNHLDRVKMLIKQRFPFSPEKVEDVDLIIKIYNEEKVKLRRYFQNLRCCFSLTITDFEYEKYTCFMVHFIDNDWKLKDIIIGVKCIERGQNMEVLKYVLSDLGIGKKIHSMVMDGDSDIYVPSSDERENMFSSPLSNCMCRVYDFDFLELEDQMKKVFYDQLIKILKYITETSSKIGTFQIAIDRASLLGKEVTAEDIPTEEMLEGMYWLSIVRIALGLKEAFFELEEIEDHFKSSINLTKEQWDLITNYYQFCYEEDLESSFDDVTSNMPYFLMLCRIYKKSLVLKTFDSSICGERYGQFVIDAKKWWDEYNLILAVAAVLDPRFKMDIVKHWYKKIYGDEYERKLAIFMVYFTDVYNEYEKGTNKCVTYTTLDILGNDVSCKSFNFELPLYLKDVNFPLIKCFVKLEWWRHYSLYFPTLARMARDFLSIQMTVPDVDIFFSTEDFDSDIVTEALFCTKSWLTNLEYD